MTNARAMSSIEPHLGRRLLMLRLISKFSRARRPRISGRKDKARDYVAGLSAALSTRSPRLHPFRARYHRSAPTILRAPHLVSMQIDLVSMHSGEFSFPRRAVNRPMLSPSATLVEELSLVAHPRSARPTQ